MINRLGRLLPAAGILGVAALAVAAGNQSHSSARTADTAAAGRETHATSEARKQSETIPASDITVNGHRVQLGANGEAKVPLPSGRAQVDVSDDGTTITTDTIHGDAASNRSNVHVEVNNSSSGGRSRSTTSIHGSSSSTTNHDTSHSSVNITSH